MPRVPAIWILASCVALSAGGQTTPAGSADGLAERGPVVASSNPAALTIGQAPVAPLGETLITVGPNVQVSAAKSTTLHGEGLIVADPTDASRLLVCSMFRDEEVGQGVVAYLSEDGGQHWRSTYETERFGHGDPACAFGPDGTAYLMMIPTDPKRTGRLRLPLLRSDDGGHTWRTAAKTGYLDRESLVVDQTTGRFRNRVYAHGQMQTATTEGLRRTGLALYASTDGKRPFDAPAERMSMGRRAVFGVGNSVVLSDGRWVGIFGEVKRVWEEADSNVFERVFSPPPEPEDAWLQAVASDDGGDSMEPPVTIAGWHMPNAYVRNSMAVPNMAADASDGPFKDRLYVVWPDTRRGGTDILLSSSADRGQTWSAPIVVNDDPRPPSETEPPNHLLPAVAVNKAGVVAVTWLDRRDAADNLGWRERIRVSLDGGETFEKSVVVSEAPARFDGTEHWPTTASTVGGGTPLFPGALFRVLIMGPFHLYTPGDYAGLAADANGVFHPYWIDNRTGYHQVWTAAVTVRGHAVNNGSEELASLDDLTQLTTLARVRSSYDRARHVATVTVRLENTSTQVLDGPFKLRLISVDSDVAIVQPVGASNRETGPGAVWDLTAAVEGAQLAPGEVSRPVMLTFKLDDVRPFPQGRVDRFHVILVRFFARVLGHTAK